MKNMSEAVFSVSKSSREEFVAINEALP